MPVPAPVPKPRSLIIATDINVLPVDRDVWREGDHLVVRCPDNPGHWWGNFLVYDNPPAPGEAEGWEAAFDAVFADTPEISHRAFTWDRGDGDLGPGGAEFTARGYDLERTVGLAAAPAEIHPHPRATADVEVRALDPDGDDHLWEATAVMQIADHDPRLVSLENWTSFIRTRLGELRELFRAGHGAWYVALDPADDGLSGACGVVATDSRGRFQSVNVAAERRGRGIASRLVVDAAADAASRHDLAQLVIVADADYHALGIYESLGFRRADRLCRLTLNRAGRPS